MERIFSLITTIISIIFQRFLNSNNSWLRMKSFYTKLLEYQSKNKSRFDLNSVKITSTPKENGVLPHLEEQLLEYPNHGKNERLLIYGTNSSSDLLIVRLETRYLSNSTDSLIRGQIILKRGHKMYKFDGIDWNNNLTNKYKIKGLMIEIISPLRKLRIKFSGSMNVINENNDNLGQKFVKFNFFWTPISGIVDAKYDFDAKFLAKDLSETSSRKLFKKVNLINFLEDRYEQYGQLIGLINTYNDDMTPNDEEEVFFWGSRYKIFVNDQVNQADDNSNIKTDADAKDDEKQSNISGACSSMRLLAFSSKYGPAISLGYVSNGRCSYRYGSAFTVPPLAWTVTKSSVTGQDLDSMLNLEGFNGKKETEKDFPISASGSRSFDLKVSKLNRLSDDIVWGTISLKGYEANCILVDERNGLLYDTVPTWLKPIPKLMSLEVSRTRREKLSNEYIYSLADVSGGHESISGGKGSSLVALTEISSSLLSNVPFEVPKGVIVSTKSYTKLLESNESLKDAILKLQEKVWSKNSLNSKNSINFEEESLQVINMFKSSKLPEVIMDHLKRKLHRIFGNFENKKFSVRSSAVGEDSIEMSAAGQMETFLGVQGIDSIVQCILKCWSSQFTLIAVNYRLNYGQLIDTNMSVVIQEMIECDCAGVMFTIDPINGNESKIIITSNYGLGESVVSGQVEPDTVTLDIDDKTRIVTRVSNKLIGSKKKLIKLRDANSEDAKNDAEAKHENNLTKLEEVEENESKICSISDENAINLGKIGLLLHDIWRCPRDIEWGIKDGVYYLFQSRPVTNLDKFSNWELMHELDSGQSTERDYLTRANVGEVLPGAMSHLCHTFIISGWGVPGFSRYKYIMGARNNMFVPYILSFFGVVNNTFFINLKNKHFAFGTEEGAGTEYAILGHRLTDEEYIKEVTEYYKMDPKYSSKWANFKILSFVFKEVLASKHRLEKYTKQFKDFNIFQDKSVNQFNDSKELLDYIIKHSWVNHYGMLLHGQITQTSILSSQILRHMLSKCNPDMATVMVDMSTILGSCSDVVSAGVPNLIRNIIDNIDDVDLFKSLNEEEALKYISENEKTKKYFNDLITNYGHRGLKEFDLLTKVWSMNPTPLIKSIKASVNGLTTNKVAKEEKEENISIDETLNSLNTKVSGNLRRILKHVIIPFARASVGWRERSKSFTINLIHQYRLAFWSLAVLMSEKEGRLPDPELLFHLKFEEIAALVKERDPNLVEKAIKRRKLWKLMDKYKFEEITKGPSIKPRVEKAYAVPKDGSTVQVKGTPVCAGKVEARICVALNLDDANDIQEGDILITYSTDIGWSPFFPLLSGLATEIGGLVSHGAVIAREFGLPCLVGVHGAPSLFKTGDRAVLDSINGTLTKL